MSRLYKNESVLELDERARIVFRDIVETYLQTGEPVGSNFIAKKNKGRSGLSPASIRNTMSELAMLGLLSAPHISAGRLPTHTGLRFFVDGLLQFGRLQADERSAIEKELTARGAGGDFEKTLEQASKTLSGLAGGAGLVLAPERDGALRHIEFVLLDSNQALAVLVYDDGHVENRIMSVPEGLMASSLERAGNYLSNRLRGRKLSDARGDILAEIESGKSELEKTASALVKQGIAEWGGDKEIYEKRTLIVRGQAKLLDNKEIRSDLERVRLLFEDIERKKELIALLNEAERADGVKIFIGAENPIFSLSGSSVIIAPYRAKHGEIVGALGVIGPTRLNYARVIPLVDYTASVIGRILEKD